MKSWRYGPGLALLGVWLLLALPAAWAGTACIQKPLTPDRLANAARLGVKVFQALEANRAQVVVLGRVGTDLAKYGLHFSHIGFAVRDHHRGRWTVIHLLNRCGTEDSLLYDEGLINFFLDDPFVYEAVIATPSPDVQQALAKALRSNLVWRLHQPRYNTIARPQSPDFQNSNQWLLELTAAALANGAVNSRREVWESPLMQSYQPDVVRIDRLTRIGGGLFKANLTFTDHPLADRLKGEYPTVTVRSVIRFLYRAKQLDRLEFIELQGAPHSVTGNQMAQAIERL
ncbi:MAG: DUF2145 domain-containing protein [Candidatus Contendobacter sp.]|nr:DUF2145 domain-containing protein [Gammaproteobacteria bacterium]MCC8993786.1 DUF2145 domain-containing protein [Candidatus Contendobacter sp.]